jgi:prevent-host-death family protein
MAKQGAALGDPMTPGASPAPVRIREVGVRELARDVSRLIKAAEWGERLVVTRHGDPVAVILSVDEAVDFLVVHSEEFMRAKLDALGEG